MNQLTLPLVCGESAVMSQQAPAPVALAWRCFSYQTSDTTATLGARSPRHIEDAARASLGLWKLPAPWTPRTRPPRLGKRRSRKRVSHELPQASSHIDRTLTRTPGLLRADAGGPTGAGTSSFDAALSPAAASAEAGINRRRHQFGAEAGGSEGAACVARRSSLTIRRERRRVSAAAAKRPEIKCAKVCSSP
jgi:hypothetical protein